MRHLIEELMTPKQFADGFIRTPTAIMLAAGKELLRLSELVKPYPRADEIEIDPHEAYNEAYNEDYVKAFT